MPSSAGAVRRPRRKVAKVNGGRIAKQYIKDILSGKIVACKWVRLFCQRHVQDLEKAHRRGLHFDEEAAGDILGFFDFLRHSKGEWAGQPFILAPWEQAFFGCCSAGKRKAGCGDSGRPI